MKGFNTAPRGKYTANPHGKTHDGKNHPNEGTRTFKKEDGQVITAGGGGHPRSGNP